MVSFREPASALEEISERQVMADCRQKVGGQDGDNLWSGTVTSGGQTQVRFRIFPSVILPNVAVSLFEQFLVGMQLVFEKSFA